MPYIAEHYKGISQFGIVNSIIRLIDIDGFIPSVDIPVVLSEEEFSEERIQQISNDLIVQNTITPEVIREVTSEVI
jgi:hypothetical protein